MSHSRDCVIGEIAALSAVGCRDAHPRARAAVDWHETLGLTQKSIAVDNKLAQARQDDSDAAYLHQAGKLALLGGDLGAGSGILKAVGSALPFAMMVAAA